MQEDTSLDTPTQEALVSQPQAKSNKVWMISTIILAFVLVVGGAFAAMIIIKGNRDTNRLSEVEQLLKEKDAKIAELEKKNQSKTTPAYNSEDDEEEDVDEESEDVDESGEGVVKESEEAKTNAVDEESVVKAELDAYIKNKRKGYSYTYKINKFGLTSDKKYYYAFITVSISEGGHESSVEYRAAKGGKWTYVNGGQSVALCSDLDSGALNFMKTYGKEVVNYMSCFDGSRPVNYGQ